MELFSKKLIPECIYTEATTPAPGVTEETQAQIIVEAVLAKVDRPEEGKRNYKEFLQALCKCDRDLPRIIDGTKLY